MLELRWAATQSAVTVYWDLPDSASERRAWQLKLNGSEEVSTVKTHHTFEGLSPDAPFEVELWQDGECLGAARGNTRPMPRRIDVTQPPYGAVGDGLTMNTGALQRALDDCGAGDEVYFPAGEYLTGALDLHSDMAIYLDRGAVLRGTDDPADYLPKIWSRFEGVERECYRSLLNLGALDHASGPVCRNVLIHGQGTICGGGMSLARKVMDVERERLQEEIARLGDGIKEYENDNTIPGRARGRLINLSNCENVRITGLTLMNGASWNVHMVYSRGIVTDHCVFRSEGVWNGDGWDPDSSEDCTLFASEFHTEDDSVAIKSGKNPEGNRVARPTRRVRVFDCVSACGLGIAVGSEMSGGVEDVRIWDCDLRHSLYGVQIKATKKRGGYVKHVRVADCVLPRFLVCAVTYNDDGEGAPEPPIMADFRCDRVRFSCWARNFWEKELHRMPFAEISGFDAPGYAARDIVLNACEVEGEGQAILRACENVTLDVRKAREMTE